MDKKQTFREILKAFVNPMSMAMITGMIIGLMSIPVPRWISSHIDASGSCMSPVAMLLTWVVVSSNSLKKAFTNVSIYIISVIRLVIFPLIFIFAAQFLSLSETIFICGVCSLSMHLGLNTIVIPSAYGKDTSVAAEMAVISHLFTVVTIPLIFSLI